MSLRVQVAGVGICRMQPSFAVFIICVQQERFEPWTVYRRLNSFALLRDQLISHSPTIAELPTMNPHDISLHSLEETRAYLDRWLQSLTVNTYILRLQATYQFLCFEANMPPPHLEVHWAGQPAGELEMDEMFDDDGHGHDDDFEEDFDDDDVGRFSAMDADDAMFAMEGVSSHQVSQQQRNNGKHSPKTGNRGKSNKKRPNNPNEDADDAADGMDIQSLSFVEAEFIYNKKDEERAGPDAERQEIKISSQSSSDKLQPKRTINLDTFKIIKVIGKGSFGKVFLVRDKSSGVLYALKVLKKSYIIKKNQVEHTKTERSVLANIHHPFIVGLNMAFQSADKLFFVLDYCSGGELFFHLGQVGRFPESRAKFYAAQIVLALEYVHGRDIVYRDLKPENVLLDSRGNVRLTDFGLSKEGVSDHSTGANSFCGTPEYIAPEVLLRTGHGRAVDWWSLGALLYEMISGLPPFYSRNRETMFAKIMQADLNFPNFMSDTAKDLLSHMLVRDPKARLGSGESDAQEIKNHPFFADIDWALLATGTMPPPWVPTMTGSLDTSQFDQEFTNMMPIVSPDVRDAYFGSMEAAFEGFTFVDETAEKYMTRSVGRPKMSSSASTAAILASRKN